MPSFCFRLSVASFCFCACSVELGEELCNLAHVHDAVALRATFWLSISLTLTKPTRLMKRGQFFLSILECAQETEVQLTFMGKEQERKLKLSA